LKQEYIKIFKGIKMQLTGVILFIGALVLFLIWGRNLYYLLRYQYLLRSKTNKLLFEYIKGIAIFIVIAIAAGMAWG
jgi:hypothetical protein